MATTVYNVQEDLQRLLESKEGGVNEANYNIIAGNKLRARGRKGADVMTNEEALLFVLERTKSNREAQAELIQDFIAEKGPFSEETARKVKEILKGA